MAVENDNGNVGKEVGESLGKMKEMYGKDGTIDRTMNDKPEKPEKSEPASGDKTGT